MNILEYAKRDPNTGMLLCGNYQSDPELVEKVARAVMCVGDKSSACTCASCSLPLQEHPDYEQVDGDSVSVERMREILAKEEYPALAKKRMLVVRAADQLRPEAANALLKELEEGQNRRIMLFTAEKELPVLPTIRSRVQIFWVPPFAEFELASWMAERKTPYEELYWMASGGMVNKVPLITSKLELLQKVKDAALKPAPEGCLDFLTAMHLLKEKDQNAVTDRETLDLVVNLLEALCEKQLQEGLQEREQIQRIADRLGQIEEFSGQIRTAGVTDVFRFIVSLY